MNKERKSRIINTIALIELITIVIVMSVGLLKGFMTGRQSNLLVGVGLSIFWLLSDVVEPFLCGRFQDLTLSRKEAYVKFIVTDLIGYAGILYFLMGVGGSSGSSSGILGAVVYVVTMKPKQNNRMIFMGLASEEEENLDEDDSDAEDASFREEESGEE